MFHILHITFYTFYTFHISTIIHIHIHIHIHLHIHIHIHITADSLFGPFFYKKKKQKPPDHQVKARHQAHRRRRWCGRAALLPTRTTGRHASYHVLNQKCKCHPILVCARTYLLAGMNGIAGMWSTQTKMTALSIQSFPPAKRYTYDDESREGWEGCHKPWAARPESTIYIIILYYIILYYIILYSHLYLLVGWYVECAIISQDVPHSSRQRDI